MAFVQFSKVSLSFGDRDILKDVSLNFASGMKAALTGANGSGKSTLMKILAGVIQPDSGVRAVEKGTRVSYLPQSGIVHSGKTLMEEALSAFSPGFVLLEKIERLGGEIAEVSTAGLSEENTGKRIEKLSEERERLQQELEESRWFQREALTRQTLTGLGFVPEDFLRLTGEFSGGWQMRIALAKILLEKPDILLLDEPTNYLDLEARQWLEDWLADFSGGFIVVSHDRFFLDNTVNEIYELFDGKLNRYPSCTYSGYEKRREEELKLLIKRYKEQQDEIAKQEIFIRRFRYKGTKAAAVQSRIKQLEKMERIEIPESLKKVHFSFPPAPHCGRIVLTAEKITKVYAGSSGGKCVLKDVDFVLEKGEKVVVVGRNGAGKSTLLRILSGADEDFSGTVTNGAGVCAGYFSQDSAEALSAGISTDKSIIDMLEDEAPSSVIPRLRDMLGAFLFRGDDVFKAVSVLSGGERNRLALLRLLFKPLNLLILDEPTNHLDIHAKDVLLDTLRRFDGSVIFVSHDRGFIEGLATRVLELTAGENGRPSVVRNFPGSYGDYLYRLNSSSRNDGSCSGSPASRAEDSSPASSRETQPASPTSSSYFEEKKQKAAQRKLEREEQRLLSLIEEQEKRISFLEEQLNQPSVYSDREKSREIQLEIEKSRSLLGELTSDWEKISEKLL